MIVVALIGMACGLALMLWELRVAHSGLAAARTVAVNSVVLVEITYLFSCRSLNQSLFSIGWFTNGWAIVGSLVMLGAQLLFTYAPVMNKLFHSAPISGESWLRIGGVAGAAFLAAEIEKWLRVGRHRQPHEPARPEVSLKSSRP